MSLITRCPACMTMFKVVPDQLRISDGWVRCGQCAEIFDATQQLVTPGATPEAPPPPTTHADSTSPVPPAPIEATSAPATEDPLPSPGSFADTWMVGDEIAVTTPLDDVPGPMPASAPGTPAHDEFIYATPDLPEPAAPLDNMPLATPAEAPPPSTEGPVQDVADDTPAPFAGEDTVGAASIDPVEPEAPIDVQQDGGLAPAIDDDPPVAATRPGFAPLTLPADPIEVPPAAPLDPAPATQPSFMRQTTAAADSLWQRPALRNTLRVLAPLLCVVLALQAVRHERDRIVAIAPDARPALEWLCQWTTCTLSPLRRIEAIVIDGSSFGRVHDNLYRLSIGIRNTADLPVLLPAVELALTNPQAQTLVRRVIDASEFGTAPLSLAPGAEWNGTLMLRIDATPAVQDIAGYGLFAFYP